MTPQDLIDDLRSRINPAYAATLGTESYERRLCAEALEAQADELDRLRDSAGKVISAFEALGRAEGIAATLEARARCERVMVALKNALTPNAELSGPRPLAAEGSRSNDVLGAARPGMTPEEEGRAAAKKGTPFKACPYTYENSKAESVEAYIAGGFGPLRDQWFGGWEKECKRIAVAENRKASKAPNRTELTGTP